MTEKSVNKSDGIAVYKRLLIYVRRYWFLMLLGTIGTIASSGVDAGFTWALKPVIDHGLIDHNAHFIKWLPLFVIVAFLLRGVTSFMSDYFTTAVGRNVVMEFRQQMFTHFLRLPATFYDQTTTGQLLSKLTFDVEQVARASSDAFIVLVHETFFVLGVLVVMFTVSWRLTLSFFVISPLIAFIARYSSKRMRRFGRYLQTGMGTVTHMAEEAISGYRVIRIFGGQQYEKNKFFKAVSNNRRREGQLIATDALASPAVQLAIAVVIAFTIYLASKTASSLGNVTAGGFASLLASMIIIIKPLKNITTVNNTIQRGIAGAESIFHLIDEKPEDDFGTIELGRVRGEVEYRNVNFNYLNTDRKVLQHINIQAMPGKTIALVGRSGSGKTTLVSLLPHFYDNYSGNILIDGIDIRQIKLASLRSQFAVVSQHVTLFNDTIARNIAYGYAEAVTEESIYAAAEAANAMEFIKGLPDGIHTLIGENGLLLSGGQRQRIAIARAILKDAPILILDEATSALDTESERHIQLALQQLMRNRTTFVIAHRLSTIENADKILVLKEGRIIESGTHDELISHSGEYAKLHAMQFGETLLEA